jgi:hypothetical protein
MGSVSTALPLAATVADVRAVATRVHRVVAAARTADTAPWQSRQRERQPPAHLVNERDSVVGEHLVRSASEAEVVRGVGVSLSYCYSLDVEAERDPLVERSGRAEAERLDGVELSIHQEADRLELLG